jgi:hypothetical protein
VSRWKRLKAAGEDVPNHWTKRTIVSYCAKCDQTFRTITNGKAHVKKSGHEVLRKPFFRGQRFNDLRGERNGAHKLTRIEVDFLRSLHRAGVSTYVLAVYFEITQQNAHTIATGKSWKVAL